VPKHPSKKIRPRWGKTKSALRRGIEREGATLLDSAAQAHAALQKRHLGGGTVLPRSYIRREANSEEGLGAFQSSRLARAVKSQTASVFQLLLQQQNSNYA